MARAAGPKAVAKNAAIGGVLLALIEGLTVLITKARKSRSASRALRARRPQTRASNPSRSSLAASCVKSLLGEVYVSEMNMQCQVE